MSSNFTRSSSEPETGSITEVLPTRAISTGTQLTPEEINQKINFFEKNLDSYLTSINCITTDNDVLEVKLDNNNKEMLLRYKIGRFNPPHKGHIDLFMRNISEMEEAKRNNPNLVTKVIIFAGNGAKGEPLSKNPLNFTTKKDVIEYLIGKRLEQMPGFQGKNIDSIIEIREKDYTDSSGIRQTPITQLTEFVSSYPNNLSLSSVKTQLAVGDKDEDASKLDFMNKALNKHFQDKEQYPDLNFTSEIIPMPAVTLEAPGGGGAAPEQIQQSATLIRKLATEANDANEFRNNVLKTGLDYGDKAEIIFNAIKSANTSSANANTSSINIKRISESESGPTKRQKPIGGTRRKRKNKKTKRRKTKKGQKTRR